MPNSRCTKQDKQQCDATCLGTTLIWRQSSIHQSNKMQSTASQHARQRFDKNPKQAWNLNDGTFMQRDTPGGRFGGGNGVGRSLGSALRRHGVRCRSIHGTIEGRPLSACGFRLLAALQLPALVCAGDKVLSPELHNLTIMCSGIGCLWDQDFSMLCAADANQILTDSSRHDH